MRSVLILSVLFSSQVFAQAEPDGLFHWDADAINEVAQEEGYTFSAKDNWVTEYLKNGGRIEDVTGLKEPEVGEDFANYDNIEVPEDLPESFDWRQQVEGGLQPIRNQRTCGSCWAFSVVAVTEALLKMTDTTLTPDLAEQTLVSTCSNSGKCHNVRQCKPSRYQ